MKLIIGLGNPGHRYEHTRHNAGFMALDSFMHGLDTISCSSHFKGHVCEIHFTAHQRGQSPIKTFFVKPQTYMNNSGEAVREIIKFYKVNIETDILIIHDEVDLKFGFWKTVFDSRAAGHNGVKSIIEHLGTQKFHRIRVGIEGHKSRNDIPTDEYVLQKFSPAEQELLTRSVFPEINKAISAFITGTAT